MRGAVGRADLVRLVADLSTTEAVRVAAFLGFECVEVDGEPAPAAVETVAAPESAPTPEHTEVSRKASEVASVPFWRAEAVSFRDEAESRPRTRVEHEPQGLTERDLCAPGRSLFATPAAAPLVPWARLWPTLLGALQTSVPGREPDVDALVRAWGRGDVLRRIPRVARRAWSARVSVWLDRSERLVPFWSDQSEVCRRLRRVYGRANMDVRVLDARTQAWSIARTGDFTAGFRPEPATPVIVLGDLGAYGVAGGQSPWLRTALRLRCARVRVRALILTPPSRALRSVARAWDAVSWERGRSRRRTGTDVSSRAERAARLLRLIAPASLVQPGLLRALRKLLPARDADAETEADVWSHPDVRVADASGLILRDEPAARWRRAFAEEVDDALKARVSRVIESWHRGLPGELLHAETLTWSASIAESVAKAPGDLRESVRFADRLARTMAAGALDAGREAALQRYGQALLAGAPEAIYELAPSLKTVWGAAFRGVDGVRVPRGVDAQAIYRELEAPGEPRAWSVRQVDDALVLMPAEGVAWPSCADGEGSPVATLVAARPRVFVSRSRRASEPERERWMSATGVDEYGRWAEVTVGKVVMRLRWIQPGRFVMGSPASELGRGGDEVPHEVELSAGYWLGETPVTQALWMAVMQSNPSEFRGAERPVEQVSWVDTQGFIGALNAKIQGLDVRLPTEAEWEYACRAGTTTATWVGDLVILGSNHASVLDTIAWYGGNSGVDFDLPDGADSRSWSGKQHDHERAGTHPVGRKQANPYGLYDMLGGVHEWCADWYGTYNGKQRHGPATDAGRVVRGGSWGDLAGVVRASARIPYAPSTRQDFVGFRLALGSKR